MKKIFYAIVVIIMCNNAHAFLSKGYNIEQLSQKSEKIFMGEVISVEESALNSTDYPYVEIRFQVYEDFKGKTPAIFSFRQFAPKVGKQFTLLGMGKNAYRPGDKLLMFLGSSGSKGLSAPIDFQLFLLQTKSNKQQDIDQAQILNKQSGGSNAKLFRNLQNPKTIQALKKIQNKPKVGVQFQDLRELIQASLP